MIKFTDTMVTFSEVPDEISLCINISNCPIHCPACHSKELWENVGEFLTKDKIVALIKRNEGITTFVISGGDCSPMDVNMIAAFVKQSYPELKVCWYSGRDYVPANIQLKNFDFIKLGPYKEEFGGLDKETTNQKFYKVVGNDLKDITYKFWKSYDVEGLGQQMAE